MTLARVVAQYEDDLICDLAETYHILAYRELPPILVATLFLGLGQNARVNRRLAGVSTTTETILLSMITDDLNYLLWSKTKNAEKGEGKPKSIAQALLGHEGTEEKRDDKAVSFTSGEDFLKAWQS